MPLPDPKLEALLSQGAPKLEPLMRWLLEASPEETVDQLAPRTERLRRLYRALTERQMLEPLREAWSHASAVRLFAETGLPDRTSLLGEGLLRLVDRVIPKFDPEGDLYAMLDRLNISEADARWIENLPDDLKEIWGDLLTPRRETWAHAARLVAHRAAAVGLSRDLLALDEGASDEDSPFFQLTLRVHEAGERPEDPAAIANWEECKAACLESLALAHERMEVRGVSTDLVFRLELLEAELTRMDQLIQLAGGRGDGNAFAAELVRGSVSTHSLRALLRTTVKRLARKIVEHTGESGEHYISRNAKEWWAMGRSAAGGGVLTAGTALVKYLLAPLPLSPLVGGMAMATNYTFSFFTMQLLGFSLASKQPAMTAAALAGALKEGENQDREMSLVAAITRTQFVAALGNVLAAMPVATGIALLWIWLTGHGPLDPDTAVHSLHSNHPFHGWTLLYAGITGILLWLSSLASGWAVNWSAYRCLPQALAQSHRLRRWIGVNGAQRVSGFVGRHFAGFIGYVALGGLLVFVPMAFTFVGIHVEVRHVTLQSASLALGSTTLWHMGALPWVEVAWGVLGVALIGALNFSVSFALALWTALRARNLSERSTRSLAWAILKELNRNPIRFLFPRKSAELPPLKH
ncbi:MAG: site-specific recombinase [Firmicutes bacterium]|nr:site-specific recombinase [Bacillota bacterium]